MMSLLKYVSRVLSNRSGVLSMAGEFSVMVYHILMKLILNLTSVFLTMGSRIAIDYINYLQLT